MAYRELVDDGGVWIVFSTHPRSGANVRPQYAHGWLSFHRGAERRRLSPIPPDWEQAGDDQMRLWLRGSEPVGTLSEDEGPVARAVDGRGVATGASVPVAEDPGRAAISTPPVEPAPPATLVRKSIDRIRAMLADIRGDAV